MFSFLKRNKIYYTKYNNKYNKRLNEIKMKIINGFELTDYDLNFIINELDENDKDELIITYNEFITYLLREYFSKE